MDQSPAAAAAPPLADTPPAPTHTLGDRLTELRYRWWPDHVLGEILAKRWMETAIPVVVLIGVALVLSSAIPNFLSAASLADTGRQAGEIGFIVLGMALVMIVGGIDLSVGSTFALTNFCALYFMHVLKWPVLGAVMATLVFGALLGAVNGVLIGYFRLRGIGVSLDHPLRVPGFDSVAFADGIESLAVSAINQLDHRLFVSEHGLDNPSTTR